MSRIPAWNSTRFRLDAKETLERRPCWRRDKRSRKRRKDPQTLAFLHGVILAIVYSTSASLPLFVGLLEPSGENGRRFQKQADARGSLLTNPAKRDKHGPSSGIASWFQMEGWTRHISNTEYFDFSMASTNVAHWRVWNPWKEVYESCSRVLTDFEPDS